MAEKSDDDGGDEIDASNDCNGGDDELGCKTISFEVSKAAIIVSGNCEAHEATKVASAAPPNLSPRCYLQKNLLLQPIPPPATCRKNLCQLLFNTGN